MQGVAHVPTEDSRKLVRTLAAVGIRHEDIGAKLEINTDTLVKYYRKELDDGRIDANAAVGKTLYEQARAGNTSAAIFWLKTRAGWKETQVNEVTGADGVPLLSGIEVKFVKPS
jgi:hypothetical protein